MPPPPFAQSITFLYVADLPAARRFYGEVLGLGLALDQGSCAIHALPNGAFLGLCRAQGPREALAPRQEGGVVLTFVTAAVEAWHAHLAAAGAEVLGPIEARPGHESFYFRDPAGYLLEIQRFTGPATTPAGLLPASPGTA